MEKRDGVIPRKDNHELEADEYVLHSKSGEIVARGSREYIMKVLHENAAKEDKTLYGIPMLAQLTGIPETTLRSAFERNEIPYEMTGKKSKASTLAAVEAWKNNPEYHKRGPKSPRTEVSKKSD